MFTRARRGPSRPGGGCVQCGALRGDPLRHSYWLGLGSARGMQPIRDAKRNDEKGSTRLTVPLLSEREEKGGEALNAEGMERIKSEVGWKGESLPRRVSTAPMTERKSDARTVTT